MEAVYFGNLNGWGRGAGNGPWVMADLENGLWAGDNQTNSRESTSDFTICHGVFEGKARPCIALVMHKTQALSKTVYEVLDLRLRSHEQTRLHYSRNWW